MFDTNAYLMIRSDSEKDRLGRLETALSNLKELDAYDGLQKGDHIIEVHETCVSRGVGTDNHRWISLTTVTETVITRVNSKTFSFEHMSGYRKCARGKYIKGFQLKNLHNKVTEKGYRDCVRVYVL